MINNEPMGQEEFATAIQAAGLDILDDHDYRLFKAALKDAEPGADLAEILASARAGRSGTAELDKAFEGLASESRAVQPKAKPAERMTGSETLDGYYNDYLKTI